jgi:wobble nucleotide-excising tRNase|tara:strand:- start:13033 stop:13332 length:300 start_codon:yes stop_codon:yes gene_type:complete
MKNNDIDSLVSEALGNIRDDRKAAREFLNEIANKIATEPDQNKYLSPVAAKHIETMQRSNEQLVKIISIQKKDQTASFELSDDDKDSIFNLIQGEPADV